MYLDIEYLNYVLNYSYSEIIINIKNKFKCIINIVLLYYSLNNIKNNNYNYY